MLLTMLRTYIIMHGDSHYNNDDNYYYYYYYLKNTHQDRCTSTTVRDHTCKIILLLQRRHNINNMFKVTVVHFTQVDISNDISTCSNDLPDIIIL